MKKYIKEAAEEESLVDTCIEICGIKISNASMQEALEKIVQKALFSQRSVVFTPNVDDMVSLQKDENFKSAYKGADYVFADAVALIWAAKWLGKQLKEKVSGMELFQKIIEISEKFCLKIALMGGEKKDSVEVAKNYLLKKYPKARIHTIELEFGTDKNKESNENVIRQINEIRPDVLMVCTGSPNSEIWIHENINKIVVGVALGLGVSLDCIAEKQNKTPSWLKENGLEWIYRILSNPQRLWKRNFLGDLQFFFYLLKFYLLKKDILEESELNRNKKNILPLSYVTETLKDLLRTVRQLDVQRFSAEDESRVASKVNECELLVQRVNSLFKLCNLTQNLFALKVKIEVEECHCSLLRHAKALTSPLVKVG